MCVHAKLISETGWAACVVNLRAIIGCRGKTDLKVTVDAYLPGAFYRFVGIIKALNCFL